MIEYMKEILDCSFKETEETIILEDKEMQILITDLPLGGIFLQVPKDPKGHIKFVKGYKKTCDYLLLTPRNDDRIDIYFVELKKNLGPGQEKEAREQIICTIPILDYLISVIKNPHGEKTKISCKNNLHFSILAEPTPFRLRKTYPKVKPITAYKINGFEFTVIYPIEAPIPIKSLEYSPSRQQ